MILHEPWFRAGSAASEFFSLVQSIGPSSEQGDLDRMWELAYRLKQFPEIDLSFYEQRLKNLESEANSKSSTRSLTELWWLAQRLNRLPRIPRTALYNSPKRMLPYYPVFQTVAIKAGEPPIGFVVDGEVQTVPEGEYSTKVEQKAVYRMRLDDLVREALGDWKVLKDHGTGSLHIYKVLDLPVEGGRTMPLAVLLNVPLELKESPAFQAWL